MPRHASLAPSATPATRTCGRLAAAVLLLALAACATGTSKTSPANDAFVAKVQRECGTKHLGALSVNDLMNVVSPRYSAYFVEITARYGQGALSWTDYVCGVMTVNGGGGSESAGLTCIQAQKP